MSSFIDKLNLRPGELRLVVLVGSVVVVVLYALFVYPEFKEWGRLQKRKDEIQTALQRYQKEIQKEGAYRKELAQLQEKGARVDSEAQALELSRTVQSQAALNGVSVNSYAAARVPAGSGGKTNAFFEEQTGTMNFVAEETALVSFLYALSSGNSLIRVSSMNLGPDPSRMKLMGNMTLVASFPKKAQAKAAAPAAASPGPGKAAPAGSGPKSISAAVSASVKPAATNAAAKASWWSKLKGVFSTGKSTNAPPKKAVATNAPPVKK